MTSRFLAACGAAFVVLILAGNSLTESVIDAGAERSSAQAARDLAAYADSTAAQIGIGLEILGLVAFAVFAAAAAVRVRASAVAGALIAIGATTLVAIKLASGAPLLAGIADHDQITDGIALSLLAINSASFVLAWAPFAVVIGALAAGLHRVGAVGMPTAAIGGVLAVLGLVAAVLGVGDVNTAMPVPFLLSLLWLAVVSLRLTVSLEDARTISAGDSSVVDPDEWTIASHGARPVS